MAEKENFETEPKEEAVEEVTEETKEAAGEDPVEETAEEETSKKEESSGEEETGEETSKEEASEKETSKEEPEEKPKDDKKKSKRFGKKKDPRDEKIAELTDKVKRQLAEFENFRTRSEKEKSQRYDMGASFIIEKMLPVLDNFERGLVDAPDDAFAEGMKMIHKQMVTALEEAGVKPIEALGQEFNPEYHNAVMQSEATDEYPSGTVSQELQKGYTYHDTVVRHSMVTVAQ